MASITDPNFSDRFINEMEEIHSKQLKTYGEIIDLTAELCQSHKQFVKSALGMFKSEILFIERFHLLLLFRQLYVSWGLSYSTNQIVSDVCPDSTTANKFTILTLH